MSKKNTISINILKKTFVLTLAVLLLATTGVALSSKAGDEELTLGYYWQRTDIRVKALNSASSRGYGGVGDQWRADCVAMQGDIAGPTNNQSTQWFHARDLNTNILGYSPRKFMSETKPARVLWQNYGDTCKRGGGPEN